MLFFFNNLFYWMVKLRGNDCPKCGRLMHRIHRKWIDHLLCLASGLKLRRYRCQYCDKDRLIIQQRHF